MPVQQGVWLHNLEGLLPRPNHPGQQDEEDAIGPRERWLFHLSLEDDQLLSQEGIFCDQFRIASAKVGQGLQHQGGPQGFGPTS